MALQMSRRLPMSWRSIRRLVWRRRSTSMRRNFIQRWWKKLQWWRVCPLPFSPYSLKESTRGKAEDQLLGSYQLEALPHLFSSWSGLKYHTSVWSEHVPQNVVYLIFSELVILNCCCYIVALSVAVPYLTNL